MLRVLLRSCVGYLRQTVVNRLSVASTRVERQWHRFVLRSGGRSGGVPSWGIICKFTQEAKLVG